MDPPPLPPLPTAVAATVTAGITAASPALHQNNSDITDLSPRSRNADTWADPLPPKLRFMCSYGGHIIPRPHDKSLCYIGGETRIIVVDRHSSLVDLCNRLSRTLLNGRPFTLKYQLPNEDLDSLISVTTDEDLDNMIEEYDRITSASPAKPARLRLFLFFAKPETAASMGSLLADAKSETWFVDALNHAWLLPRGLSDSATMDCLLNLDRVPGSDSCNDLQAQADDSLGENSKQVAKNAHDVHSMPDSPMVENSSSFGSSSSSPSMSNLPPIRVRVEDNGARLQQDPKVGVEEQFAQMNFGLPPLPTALAVAGNAPSAHITNPAAVPHENANRAFSDDERSDHGPPVGVRKPPLPLQPLQTKAIGGGGGCVGGFSLPSPDSATSDNSIASASSLQKPTCYQDQVHNTIAPVSPDTQGDISAPATQKPIQQFQYSGFVVDQQQPQQLVPQQQQFAHPSMHYIHHTAAGPVPVPVSPYYPIYAPPPQQQLHPHALDQQYPAYVMPISQTQPYSMPVQANASDTSMASGHPLPSTNPAIVAASATYKDGTSPLYQPKAPSPAAQDLAASVYKTAMASNPSLLQVPANQFQQQYLGFPQMHHPSQSFAVAPSASAANYGFEYANPPHDQLYGNQHHAAPLPSQYQTMTPAAAVSAVALSDASNQQLPADCTQQQIRT